MAMSEFDQFSVGYEQLLDASVAITGEKSEYFASYKTKFIAEKIAPRPGCKILDYGCGVGLVCNEIKKQVPQAQIDGFDVSQASLGRVDPALRLQGVFSSEVSKLSRDYDVVFLANVMHHVEPKDRQQVISEAAGLLRRGGRLVIFEHNPRNPLTRRAVDQCPFDGNAILLPSWETKGYLAQSGFRRIGLDYIVFFPSWLRWLRPLEPFLRWCPAGAQYAATGLRE